MIGGRRFESGPGASRVAQQVEQGSRIQSIAGDGDLAFVIIPSLLARALLINVPLGLLCWWLLVGWAVTR